MHGLLLIAAAVCLALVQNGVSVQQLQAELALIGLAVVELAAIALAVSLVVGTIVCSFSPRLDWYERGE